MSEMKSLYLSKEQFYKECHISKRTALWLIQSGLVPAIDTGRRTCRYLIARDDVETYLQERELHPAEYHYIKSAAEAPRTSCPAPRGKGGQAALERLWANELDLLTLERVMSLLLRRDELTIIERGKAYRALLEAKRKQGYRSDITSGDNRQKFLAREVVAQFFGVTEYEIRKAVKLTYLIPQLQDILVDTPKRLNLVCAELIADYDPASQDAFVEICSIEGYAVNKATMNHIIHACPPPSAERQAVFAAWQEARAKAEQRTVAQPKKISFERKLFQPYLDKLGSDKELERLFLEFLREKVV